MSLLKAASHYGLGRKKYRFEMKVHQLILPTSANKLIARVIWSRRKKHSAKYQTSWIEGIEEFYFNECLKHSATIFLTATTNQIQSKYTSISVEIKEQMNDAKYTKYCAFKLDLSDFIDTKAPKKIFSKHLKYKNAKGTKKAELIFSMTSKEEININDRDSLFSENSQNTDATQTSATSETTPSSNVSINSLRTTMEQIHFNELRKNELRKQRQLNDQQNNVHIAPTIVRRHHNSAYIHSNSASSATASTVSTNSDQNSDQNEMDSPYAKYSKYIQKKHDNDDLIDLNESELFDHMQPPPFDVMNNTQNENKNIYRPRIQISKSKKKNKRTIAGSAISICSTEDEESENDDIDDRNDHINEKLDELTKLRMDVLFYKKQMKEYKQMKENYKKQESEMDKMRKNMKILQKDNLRLQLKVSSLQTVIEHGKNQKKNSFANFEYLSFEQCLRLKVGDYIDHRDETGHFLLAKIIDTKKNYVQIHYEGWASKWDEWVNYKEKTKNSHFSYIAKARSISRRASCRFMDIAVGDDIDINPTLRQHGWKRGKIKKMDKYSGQCQVEYLHLNKQYFYWAHLNDVREIAPFMTKSSVV